MRGPQSGSRAASGPKGPEAHTAGTLCEMPRQIIRKNKNYT
jgi:hypothetical protein